MVVAVNLIAQNADLERRFGGLRRLYGAEGYARLRAARVAVVGVGGVGSWAAEALARSGVARLVLVDLDHISESNINRQVQALSVTLGMAKTTALASRIADIHPACIVDCIEEFADATNWPQLLPTSVDAVIDACDQSHAKLALAAWSLKHRTGYVCCGAAGGKQRAEKIEIEDLSLVTHDRLLAGLRQRLRTSHSVSRHGLMGVRCVFSRESVWAPSVPAADITTTMESAAAVPNDHSLNCHGYGSSVTVTASFGMAAAGEIISQLLHSARL